LTGQGARRSGADARPARSRWPAEPTGWGSAGDWRWRAGLGSGRAAAPPVILVPDGSKSAVLAW